ncbi:entericidin A/B family lipoprotein [Legionella oakridgensis]|nr:entericidin A/B family lipoprotein [Legionella oakridgensis]
MCSACLFLSGCNTVKGFGKDVSQGGQEIEQAANKASSSL